MVKARDRVRAIRTVGVDARGRRRAARSASALATPAFAGGRGTNDPARGDAVAAFIEVLIGRLVGAGLGASSSSASLLALAPGHDGGDLAAPVARVRAWLARRSARSPRWRFAGGVALVVARRCSSLTQPRRRSSTDARGRSPCSSLYVGVVVCLRATGLLVTDHSIPRLHKRQVVGVFAAMIVVVVLTADGRRRARRRTTPTEPRRTRPTRAATATSSCAAQPLNQVVWPASHNAMSSAAYNFLGAEHTITIPEQLNAGARFLMLDAYYGYDDDGLVRTNLAGGVDRKQLEKERGEDAVRALDRLGALTGTADTSGKKQDIYFCHDFCELGAVPASEVFGDIGDFLDRNLTDVVILDVEDYVKPKDLKPALDRRRPLRPRVDAEPGADRRWPLATTWWCPTNKDDDREPAPADRDEREARRRVAVAARRRTDCSRRRRSRSPRSTTSTASPNRGGTDKPFFIVNHWLRPDGPPDPVAAGKVNSQKVLTERLQQCIAQRAAAPQRGRGRLHRDR